MASLSGQSIQSTYQGLLKLADSTTGITSSFQAVQDGLGNDTGLRIATNQLESDNINSFVPLRARYYGAGYNNASASPYSSGMQNIIIATPFYDNGNYSYSAMSFNVLTGSTEVVEMALYTTQLINPSGLFPYSPVISGLTADTTTTGIKTITFPTPISFSGYGAGVYWLVWKINNAGGAPVIRISTGNAFTTGLSPNLFQSYGFAQSFTTNVLAASIRGNNGSNSFQSFSGLTTFDNPYSTTINTAQSTSTSLTGNAPGFLLHTVDA
jgi:hypothetical protein